MTLPVDFSSANLNVGNSLPDSTGSGTLFMKLGSPPAATRVAIVAVVAAASAAAPERNSRRWKSDMLQFLLEKTRERSFPIRHVVRMLTHGLSIQQVVKLGKSMYYGTNNWNVLNPPPTFNAGKPFCIKMRVAR